MGYARSQSDANKEDGNNPSHAGSQKATEEFVELLNHYYYNQWNKAKKGIKCG